MSSELCLLLRARSRRGGCHLHATSEKNSTHICLKGHGLWIWSSLGSDDLLITVYQCCTTVASSVRLHIRYYNQYPKRAEFAPEPRRSCMYHRSIETILTYACSGNSSSVHTFQTNFSPLIVPLLNLANAFSARPSRFDASMRYCEFGCMTLLARRVGMMEGCKFSLKKEF